MSEYSEFTADRAPLLTPIPVAVTNIEALRQAARKRHSDVTFRTIVLSASQPFRAIFAADLSRRLVIVQAFTNDVVLCETQSKAQDAANAATGLPNPEGYLLKATNTTPTYLPTTDLAWAAAASFPAMITICLINEVPG